MTLLGSLNTFTQKNPDPKGVYAASGESHHTHPKSPASSGDSGSHIHFSLYPCLGPAWSSPPPNLHHPTHNIRILQIEALGRNQAERGEAGFWAPFL